MVSPKSIQPSFKTNNNISLLEYLSQISSTERQKIILCSYKPSSIRQTYEFLRLTKLIFKLLDLQVGVFSSACVIVRCVVSDA